jgi:hypothetical protein
MQAQLKAALICTNSVKMTYQTCDDATNNMKQVLQVTDWFSDLSSSEEDADLIIYFSPPVIEPYYTPDHHEPVIFPIAIVIPFWFSETFGNTFKVSCNKCSTIRTVDTKRNGKILFWGFASIVNLFPNRDMKRNDYLEIDHTKLQLAPIIKEFVNDI